MTIQRVATPSAVLRFPLRMSPYLDALQEDDRKWLPFLLQDRSEELIQRYLSYRSYRYTAYCWPDAAYEQAILLNHWIGWGFTLDDTLGKGVYRTDPGRVYEEFIAPLIALQADPEGTNTGTRSPLISGFADFWKQMIPLTGAYWRQRFIRHEIEWLSAYCWESQINAQGVWLDEASYRRMRLVSVSSYILYDLVEFALQLELAPEIYESPGCQRLLSHSLHALTWDNDLTSAAKEDADGEKLNLVLIRKHYRECTLEEAADSVCVLIASEVKQFLESAEQLIEQFPAQKLSLQRYITGVQSLMVGTGTWQRESKRYDPSGVAL